MKLKDQKINRKCYNRSGYVKAYNKIYTRVTMS